MSPFTTCQEMGQRPILGPVPQGKRDNLIVALEDKLNFLLKVDFIYLVQKFTYIIWLQWPSTSYIKIVITHVHQFISTVSIHINLQAINVSKI